MVSGPYHVGVLTATNEIDDLVAKGNVIVLDQNIRKILVVIVALSKERSLLSGGYSNIVNLADQDQDIVKNRGFKEKKVISLHSTQPLHALELPLAPQW